MRIYGDDMRELRARQDGQIKGHNQFSAVMHLALGGLAVGYMTWGNRWMLVLVLMLIWARYSVPLNSAT